MRTRSVRTGTHRFRRLAQTLGDAEALAREMLELEVPPGGNIAFFEIRFDGTPPRTSIESTEGVAFLVELSPGRWVIGARSQRGAHSEALCIQLLREIPAERRRPVIVEVFTEREPCHDGAPDCMARLSAILDEYGSDEAVVYFLDSYMSRSEATEAGAISGRGRSRERSDNRRQARSGSRGFRRTARAMSTDRSSAVGAV